MPRKWPSGHYYYELCYPSGTPYYVGIGSGARAGHTGRNLWANNVAAKIRSSGGQVLVRLVECSSRESAAEMEIEAISKYGRRFDGSGILTNIKAGGEGGASGKILLDPLDREKLRAVLAGEIEPEPIIKLPRGWHLKGNKNLLGFTHTQESKDRISASLRGKSPSLTFEDREGRSQRIAERNKTCPPPNSLQAPSEETKRKQSEVMRRRAAGENIPTQKERRAARKAERQRNLNLVHN